MTETDENALTVEEVRTLSGFEEMKAAWDDLCDRAVESYPMLSHAWLRSWWNTFGRDLDCRVLLVRRGEALVGAVPVALRHQHLFLKKRRVLTLFSNAWVDRTHLLVAEPTPAFFDAVFDHLSRSDLRYDVINLFPLDSGCELTSLLEESLHRLGYRVGTKIARQSPYLTLPESWEEVLQGLSSSFRQTVKRKIRKVDAMPNVTMRVVRDASCLAPIADISLESWQHDEGTSMASTEDIASFYAPIIRSAAEEGSLRCGLLEVDGEPAAFEFNLLHRSTLHNLKLGFKKKFSDLSSGIVLKAYILKQTLDGGGDGKPAEYDFMGTAEPYKLNWTKSIRVHNDYYVFARRWDMHLVHWIFFELKPRAKRRLGPMLSALRAARKRES